jgi:hypothetical protein
VPAVQDIDDDDDDTTMFAVRVSQLEEQRRELVTMIRQEQQAGDLRVAQLETDCDDEEATFAAEVEPGLAKLVQQEETGRQQAHRLSGELRAVQERRRSVALVNDRKIDEWQARIDITNEEFRQQLRDATLAAERLRAAVTSANLRSTVRLEAEMKRGQDRQRLRKETLELRVDLFNREKEVQIARDESQLLRREISGKFGASRTASLFR